MNLMIQIYMTVCVVLLLFDIGFLLVKNLRNHRFYPRNLKFEQQLLQEIENRKTGDSDSFSDGFAEVLYKKLSKTKNLIALQGVLEQNPEVKKWFRESIFLQIDNYKKKPDYEQAYYTYVVSTLGYEDEKLPTEFAGEFLAFLDSKSLYTFINTMTAIYQFGEVRLILTAMDKVDERPGFYHKKLVVDGLLGARVDKKELGDKLMERFSRYSLYTKECILDYLRFAQVEATDFCMGLIFSADEDQEVRYAAMRYFVKYPNKKSEEFFIEVLKKENDEWIKEMLAIQGLSKVSEPEIRALIKGKITSRNWYVRVNAADYLHKHGLDKKEIKEILSMKDRYTNETLLYQYRNDETMSAYIVEVIEELSKEAEKVEGGDASL